MFDVPVVTPILDLGKVVGRPSELPAALPEGSFLAFDPLGGDEVKTVLRL